MVLRRHGLASFALAAGLGFWAASCSGERSCSVCAREECRNLSFTIRLQSGKSVQTCCPRCGLHYLEQAHPAVASLLVRDFDSARPLDARSAFYVEGSDVTPCSSMHASAPPRDERGCCLKAVYDRCLPSVLAFGSRERAEGFAREHGGTVKTLGEVETRRSGAG